MDRETGFILAAAAATLATAYLLRLAWRGRRIGDGRCCAHCDYLLTGLPETSSRCPECGTEVSLATGQNVRTGGRRRSWPWVTICAVLLIAAIGWEKHSITGWFHRPAERKPTWLLLRNAGNQTATTRQLALLELRKRANDGELSAEQHTRLVEAALAQMATFPNFYGVDGTPAWVFDQRAAGQLSDGQWKRLFDLAPPVLVMRPVVSSIEPFDVKIRETPLRWAVGSEIQYEISSISVDGTLLQDARGHLPIDLGRRLPGLAPGKHELHVKTTARIPGTTRVQWTGTQILPFENRTDGTSSVQLIHDPVKVEEYKKLISVTLKVEKSHTGSHVIDFDYSGGLYLSHDVYLRYGKQMKNVMLLQGGGIIGMTHGLDLPRGVNKVDVLLRPNQKAAAQTIDIVKLLNHEFVFNDVSIARSPENSDSE